MEYGTTEPCFVLIEYIEFIFCFFEQIPTFDKKVVSTSLHDP